MLDLTDMNQSWRPPPGFNFAGVTARGSYLLVEYIRRNAGDAVVRGGWTNIVIYLESQGREVMRTTETIYDLDVYPPRPSAPPEPKPVPRRFRFWNGFLLALQGLQEMVRCLKK